MTVYSKPLLNLKYRSEAFNSIKTRHSLWYTVEAEITMTKAKVINADFDKYQQSVIRYNY